MASYGMIAIWLYTNAAVKIRSWKNHPVDYRRESDAPIVFGYGPQGADYGWLFAHNDIITLLDLCFKLFFHQCPTGMQGSGFVIFCHCLCTFAALVGDSPFLMPVDHIQLPFPFRCFGCNRLVITEKFTRQWVWGLKRAIELERGGMSYLIHWLPLILFLLGCRLLLAMIRLGVGL